MDETKIEHRLTCLENGQKSITDKIDELIHNHIRHLQDSIRDVESKMNSRPSWLISLIITTLVGLVTYFITRSF